MKKETKEAFRSCFSKIVGLATIIACFFTATGIRLCNNSPEDTTKVPPSEIVSEDSTSDYHQIRADTTTWDKIFLPFIKHEKMNYHKYEWDEKGWKVSIGYLAIIGLLLIGILGFGAYSLGYFDGADSSGNLYGKILSGGIAIVLLIYLILRILVQFGFY